MLPDHQKCIFLFQITARPFCFFDFHGYGLLSQGGAGVHILIEQIRNEVEHHDPEYQDHDNRLDHGEVAVVDGGEQ